MLLLLLVLCDKTFWKPLHFELHSEVSKRTSSVPQWVQGPAKVWKSRNSEQQAEVPNVPSGCLVVAHVQGHDSQGASSRISCKECKVDVNDPALQHSAFEHTRDNSVHATGLGQNQVTYDA